MELVVLRFSLVPQRDIRVQPYPGGLFRNVFGFHFRKTVCVADDKTECEHCPGQSHCWYAYVFKALSPGRHRGRESEKTHPFTVTPPFTPGGCLRAGEPFPVIISLMGAAIDALPYVSLAVRKMAQRGLGRKLIPLVLTNVEALPAGMRGFLPPAPGLSQHGALTNVPATSLSELLEQTPGESDRLVIEFLSPARYKARNAVVKRQTFAFPDLIQRLYERVEALTKNYGHGDEWAYGLDMAEAASVAVPQDRNGLHWVEAWARSRSTEQDVELSGLIGSAELEGDLTPFLPLLRWGEVLHVGSKTSYGLGRYIIHF